MKTPIGTIEDFPLNKPTPVEVDGVKVIVVRTSDNIFAMENCCPHQSRTLEMSNVLGKKLQCIFHGVTMEMDSGSIVNDGGYNALEPIKTFEISLEDDKVYLSL